VRGVTHKELSHITENSSLRTRIEVKNMIGTSAYGVNNNGTIIVGKVGIIGDHAVYWVDGSPPIVEKIPPLTGGTHITAFSVSNDGGIVVGHSELKDGSERAFRWKKDSIPEMENLGILDGYTGSFARDLNSAGDIIVGYSYRDVDGTISATLWNDTSGPLRIEVLRSPQGTIHCYAHGIDDDGTNIVGNCILPNDRRRAICWLGGKTTEVTTLQDLANQSHSSTHAVSGDGNVIVGYSTEPGDPSIGHAVRWRRNSVTSKFNIENLGVRPTTHKTDRWFARAFGVNYDGTVIVGECAYPGTSERSTWSSEAFIWREDATPKAQKLEDATEGYKLSVAYDVIERDDGTIIAVGNSTPRDGDQIAVRWNNLSIENLHFS